MRAHQALLVASHGGIGAVGWRLVELLLFSVIYQIIRVAVHNHIDNKPYSRNSRNI